MARSMWSSGMPTLTKRPLSAPWLSSPQAGASARSGRTAATGSMAGRWTRTKPLAVGAPGRAVAEGMSAMRNSDVSSNETSGNGLKIGDCVIGPTFLDDLK